MHRTELRLASVNRPFLNIVLFDFVDRLLAYFWCRWIHFDIILNVFGSMDALRSILDTLGSMLEAFGSILMFLVPF